MTLNSDLFQTLSNEYLKDIPTTCNHFIMHDSIFRIYQNYGYKTIIELSPHDLQNKIVPFLVYENNTLRTNQFHPLVLFKNTKQYHDLQNCTNEFDKLILSVPSPHGNWLIKFKQ
jgi:hypothetical protein